MARDSLQKFGTRPRDSVQLPVCAGKTASETEADSTVDSADDRRQETRRQPGMDRAFSVPDGDSQQGLLHPVRWPYLIPSLVVAVSLSVIFSTTLPSWPVLSLLGFSLIASVCVKRVQAFFHGSGAMGSLIGAVLAVTLPLILFGLGTTLWLLDGGIDQAMALAGLVCIGGVAAAYLWRHPGLIFGSQMAVWSPMVLAHGSIAGGVALFVALSVAIQVSREQMAEQRKDEQRQQARDRVQTRARDILADYEQTRQGWFWETDRRSLLTYISAPVAAALGATPEDLLGLPLVTLFDLKDTGQEGERTLLFHLTARSSFQELQVRAAIPDEERWWSVSGRPIYDEFANFVGFRGSGTDLTERKRSQEDASRLAHYDSLTGLANRFQMSQTLEKILGAPQGMNRECAVFLLDLDSFKHVNDTMGHPAGDALLKQVSERLQRVVADTGRVGRLGGDEFQVVVPGRTERRVLGNLAQHIIHNLSQPYSIDGQRVVIGASLGIAVCPDDGITRDDLIRNADLALYAAKDGGRGRYHFYADDLHAAAEERSQMERDLRDALAAGQLELFYQPVVSTATERIAGFEALLRWQHPQKGWISPSRFVQIAEDSGMIEQIGEWALRTACLELSQWPDEVRCAVNVSPLQFANPNLPVLLTNAIAQAGIDPSRLELEITESVFLNDDAGTEAMFAALKAVGVRLALDDFGTGYSSLGYLKKAPFDKIKIDQSLVRGATQPGSRNGAIIASIISLAQALGMDTTAEGVETHDELDLVRLHGCSHVQGYIYERPLSAAEAAARLEKGLEAVAEGPRASRSPRQTMLRKVVLEHDGQMYNAKIRNLSVTGALIEGLWNVPPGTQFTVHLSLSQQVVATARWSREDQAGMEFAERLQQGADGRMDILESRPPEPVETPLLRRAG